MNNALLDLRFVGPTLKRDSIPIYDLGVSLISIQRIIHKAYLHEKHLLQRGAHLSTDERRLNALQIVKHEKTSDLWGFAPFLTDPALGPIWQTLIASAIAALSAYAANKVIPAHKSKSSPQQNLIINIFPEVKSISDRIDNIGGVTSVQIGRPSKSTTREVIFTPETRDYVRQIETEDILAPIQELSGVVTKLYPQSYRLDIKIAPNQYVEVSLPQPSFERIRRHKSLNERTIVFTGHPLLRLGQTSERFDRFIAEKIRIPREK